MTWFLNLEITFLSIWTGSTTTLAPENPEIQVNLNHPCSVTEEYAQWLTAAGYAQCTQLHEAKSLDRLWCWEGVFVQPLWRRTSPSLNYPMFLCGGEQLSRCGLSSRASLSLINETLINPSVWCWCPWRVIMCGYTHLYIGGEEGTGESLFIVQDEPCIPSISQEGLVGHFSRLWPILRLLKSTWSLSQPHIVFYYNNRSLKGHKINCGDEKYKI